MAGGIGCLCLARELLYIDHCTSKGAVHSYQPWHLCTGRPGGIFHVVGQGQKPPLQLLQLWDGYSGVQE